MAGGGISATRGEAADEDGGDDAAEEAHDVGKLRLTRLRSEVAARETDERESLPASGGPLAVGCGCVGCGCVSCSCASCRVGRLHILATPLS